MQSRAQSKQLPAPPSPPVDPTQAALIPAINAARRENSAAGLRIQWERQQLSLVRPDFV